MEVITKITKPKTFQDQISEVDTKNLKIEGEQYFSGQSVIIRCSGSIKTFYGYFVRDEFEFEYGFQLKSVSSQH